MAARKRNSEWKDGGGSAGQRVWRFVDYHRRFWADTNRKDIDLQQYIRWYINAWTGPGGEVLAALNQLRRYGNFIELQGALIELLTVATNTSPEFQGLLLSSRKEPMQTSEVASILRVNGRKALVVLTRLQSVGFLEKVPWPRGSPRERIPDDQSLRLLQDGAPPSKKGDRKGGAQGPSRAENPGEPFTKHRRSEDKAAQAMVEGTAPGETPPSPSGPAAETEAAVKLRCPACGHEGQAPKGTAKAGQCTQCGTLVPTLQTSTSTTSTDPDGWVGPAKGTTPSASPKAHPPLVLRFEQAREIQPHKYSAAANAFGQQICAAFGYVASERSDYVNEVAHFAMLYDDQYVTLSDISQAKAWEKILRVAGEVRTGKKRPECPGAYMERVVQNAIRDRKRAKKGKTG